jgi:hypothetical protein
MDLGIFRVFQFSDKPISEIKAAYFICPLTILAGGFNHLENYDSQWLVDYPQHIMENKRNA